MPEPTSWTPLLSAAIEVGKIILGGVVAASVTLGVNGRRQSQESERAASAFAIRLIDHFERYAMACANVPAGNERRDPFITAASGAFLRFPHCPTTRTVGEAWISGWQRRA